MSERSGLVTKVVHYDYAFNFFQFNPELAINGWNF